MRKGRRQKWHFPEEHYVEGQFATIVVKCNVNHLIFAALVLATEQFSMSDL